MLDSILDYGLDTVAFHLNKLHITKGLAKKIAYRKSIFYVTTLYIPHDYLDVTAEEKPAPKVGRAYGDWERPEYKRSRRVGFFLSFKAAEKAILENWCDIYENGYYNLAMIGKTAQGLYPHAHQTTWYSVDPILNEEVIERDKARKKAFDEACFFGKSLGFYMLRQLEKEGAETESFGGMVNGTKRFSEKIGMDWVKLNAIDSGDAAPDFTPEQWMTLTEEINLSSEELEELNRLRLEALVDTEHNGKPAALWDKPTVAVASGPKDGPAVKDDNWSVKDYRIGKIKKPRRLQKTYGLGDDEDD